MITGKSVLELVEQIAQSEVAMKILEGRAVLRTKHKLVTTVQAVPVDRLEDRIAEYMAFLLPRPPAKQDIAEAFQLARVERIKDRIAETRVDVHVSQVRQKIVQSTQLVLVERILLRPSRCADGSCLCASNVA